MTSDWRDALRQHFEQHDAEAFIRKIERVPHPENQQILAEYVLYLRLRRPDSNPEESP